MTEQESQKQFMALIESAKGKIQDYLPKHLTAERFAKTALLAASKNPTLYKCSAASIVRSLVTAAELGLEPSGTLGSAYLVPFWNSSTKCHEAILIPGYRGLIDLARRSGLIKRMVARVVYANDQFDVVYGAEESLLHVPDIDNPGEKRLAYAIAFWPDGKTQFEVMSRAQIESIKARSKSRDKEGRLTGPWVTDEDEMWRKTVVRRLCKYLPLSPELARGLEVEDEVYETRAEPVDLTGILNAPSETIPRIDIDSIQQVDPQTGEIVETKKPTAKPARKTKLADELAYHGLSLDLIEDFLGLPRDQWGKEVTDMLFEKMNQIREGAAVDVVFPGIADLLIGGEKP